MNTEAQTVPKIGAWQGGFLLARASWSALRLDKELIIFPILSSIAGIISIGLISLVAVASGADTANTWTISGILILFLSYLLLSLCGNFFGAAIISSALLRFKGGDPTVQYGIDQAKKHFGSLFKLSLVTATIGVIVRFAEEKLPLAGKILGWVTDIAWSIATIFALSVIVSSEKPVGPIEAVKESANVFKKVWAKGFVGNLGMGVVFLIGFLVWAAFAALINILAAVINPALLFVSVPVSAIVFIVLISLASALGSIFQAALYHYATTGESPVEFDKDLLHAAFRHKKGWFE